MLGLSQLQFAEDLGVAQNTLSNYESEKRQIPLDLLKRIAERYDVTIDYLTDSDLIADDRIPGALINERVSSGLSLQDLSKITKIPKEDLEDYEAEIEPINLFLLKKLCAVYGKSLSQFYKDNDLYDEYIPSVFNGDSDRFEQFESASRFDAESDAFIDMVHLNNYKYVPSAVSAGALTNIEGINTLPTVSVPDFMMGRYAGNKNIILMSVNGESMNKVIPNGAVIAVLTDVELCDIHDGDIVVIKNGGEYTVKRFYNDIEHQEFVFKPDSSILSFRDIIFGYDASDDLYLVGKVVMYNVTL
jgi:transcriptional regulator with XRE-family HTH domain